MHRKNDGLLLYETSLSTSPDPRSMGLKANLRNPKRGQKEITPSHMLEPTNGAKLLW